jgi:hypothetical protein
MGKYRKNSLPDTEKNQEGYNVFDRLDAKDEAQ